MCRRTIACLHVAITMLASLADASEAITFASHTAAIVHVHCSVCHRPGGTASLQLVSHRDLVANQNRIRELVQSGEMPPWQPIGDRDEFVGDRRLSPQQKELLLEWIDGGCVEGDYQAAPTPPHEATGWAFGKPDLVVQAAALSGGKALAAELDWPADGYLTSLELRPRSASFQHALLWLDLPLLTGAAEVGATNTATAKPFWGNGPIRDRLLFALPSPLRPAQRMKAAAARDRAFLGVWAFDSLAQSMPENAAIRIPAGSRLLIETAELRGDMLTKPVEVGFHFAAAPPQRLVSTAALEAVPGSDGITRERPLQGSFRVPVDCELVSLAPHVGKEGREVRVGLTLPDGRSESLLWIEKWNPRWETCYRYRRPLQIPKGSRLNVSFVVDRSGAELPESSLALVAAQLMPVKIEAYADLVRAIQKRQIEVASVGDGTLVR